MADDITEDELQRWVVYAFLRGATRLAMQFGLPLKETKAWAEMALFHEARDRGLKMREASELLDVSMRKVALLSKQLKENFRDPDVHHGVPRRIEFMLLAAPLSRARIAQAMPDVEAEDIDAALEKLLGEGRIEEIDGRVTRYQRTQPTARLVRDQWMARIDGLNNLVANVTHAALGRFFHDEPDALARTLTLRVRPKDMGALRELYENVIWERLKSLDEDADGDPTAEAIDVSICWAPFDYVQRLNGQPADEPEGRED